MASTKTAEKVAALFENYEEVVEPVDTKVEGEIPSWLNVSLLRNGPGMFNIGDYQYKHWFDGMAYMQRFGFANGKMTYSAKYLQSETLKINLAANRIVVNEFGTFGYSDPCKSVLGKLSTFLTEDHPLSDNASVNFFALGDTVWAATETPKLSQIDPKTLETLSKTDVSKIVSLNTFTAHQQYDSEGNVYHIGSKFGKRSEYVFAVTKNPKNSKTPPPSDNPFAETSVIGTLTATDDPCYNHSFGMTENYIILFETPLRISIWSLLTRNVRGLPFRECMYWKEDTPVFVRILDKRTGKEVSLKYRHEAFFSFHQANAYERDGCIIMDYCQIKKAGDLKQFELENLRNNGLQKTEEDGIAYGSRLVIPMEVDLAKFKEGDDLIKGKKFAGKCKAILKGNSEIWLEQENWTEIGFEFPRYNMNYNLKPYRYIYGSTLLGTNDKFYGLLKIDLQTREVKTWSRDHDLQIAAEPVFVPHPTAIDEDDGVVLAPIVNFKPNDAPFVVVLDAKTFTEIARCKIPHRLPLGFHAQYYNN